VFEIGNSLREARTRQGLGLSEVEVATKIRSKYLRALEEEQFDALPAQTYVKGFLRTYADYLGLDGQLYVDEYNSRYVVDPAEEFFRPRRSPQRVHRAERRFESRVLVLALVGIAAVTALVIAAWRFGSSGGKAVLPPQAKPAAHHAPTQAHVVVRAVRGSSYVEVHLRSALGVPVFGGTMQRGESQSFDGKRLWLRVRVPSALRVTVNGKAVKLPHRGPAVLVATKRGVR
jgi:cytoskeletal protein RodZ